jgi:putative transcriptional regulator
MRDSMKEALGSLAQGLIESGLGSAFSEKELNELGVNIPAIENITPAKIKMIREQVNLTQTVFACLLNVSVTSVTSVLQREQGKRSPNGASKVLL